MAASTLKIGKDQWLVVHTNGRVKRVVVYSADRVAVYQMIAGNDCIHLEFDTQTHTCLSAQKARLHDFALDTVARVIERGSATGDTLEPWITSQIP